MEPTHYLLIALTAGFLLDELIGDPKGMPHPIVGFGNLISFFEKRLNKGSNRLFKGALMTLMLVTLVFVFTYIAGLLLDTLHPAAGTLFNASVVFFSLSGLTLRREVRKVFAAVNRTLEEGRYQLSRIVGRDTSELQPQQIRTAALETLAENLSDGVIAPLFWFALLGAPGIFAYKMINTLDSMIGYKNDRYLLFGRFAARLDDAANFVPARITALLMLIVSGKLSKIGFVLKYGKCHTSPNSGYPESALAAILNCRFGGPNSYFGKIVDKPYIGENEKTLGTYEMIRAFSVNRWSEVVMFGLVCLSIFFWG